MTDNIKPIVRNIKVQSFRTRVSADHLTVTPKDSNGNTCVIVIVIQFCGFMRSYAAKDYTAETLARSLFLFYSTYGRFDEFMSDPGSAMQAEAIEILHSYLGMHQRVSIVDRPESNGVERRNQDWLRHVRAIVHDLRVKDRWGR